MKKNFSATYDARRVQLLSGPLGRQNARSFGRETIYRLGFLLNEKLLTSGRGGRGEKSVALQTCARGRWMAPNYLSFLSFLRFVCAVPHPCQLFRREYEF